MIVFCLPWQASNSVTLGRALAKIQHCRPGRNQIPGELQQGFVSAVGKVSGTFCAEPPSGLLGKRCLTPLQVAVEKEPCDMQKAICRWGILGAAEIARKNWQAIRNAPNCSLTAVASRDLDRCRRFIGECQRHAPFDPPPRACGSYEELLASDDVDAVYIPLPTGIRKPWAIRAAEAGKHVLVEKPVGATRRTCGRFSQRAGRAASNSWTA